MYKMKTSTKNEVSGSTVIVGSERSRSFAPTDSNDNKRIRADEENCIVIR